MSRRNACIAAALAAVSALLTACGGGGSTASITPQGPPPDLAAPAIQGVATPSSVSVVTATNAN
jgi:hypothetical protein